MIISVRTDPEYEDNMHARGRTHKDKTTVFAGVSALFVAISVFRAPVGADELESSHIASISLRLE
jgi:hypothetical protein